MEGFKVWIIAQFLTFIGYLLMIQDEAAFMASIITALAGIPSIFAFVLWYATINNYNMRNYLRTILTLIAIPAITACNALALAYLLDLDVNGLIDSETISYILNPTISSFVAAAFFSSPYISKSTEQIAETN